MVKAHSLKHEMTGTPALSPGRIAAETLDVMNVYTLEPPSQLANLPTC
jgi:hypothetical protein